MTSKNARRTRILELVRRHQVSSQEELAVLLERAGIAATQSTLSRDIRELGLVKARGLYRVAGEIDGVPTRDLLSRTFQQLVVERGISGNILLVRTAPGNAHSLGVVLDAARWPEVLGTVADADTVVVLLRNPLAGEQVLRATQDVLSWKYNA